jgi:hypothetical protein
MSTPENHEDQQDALAPKLAGKRVFADVEAVSTAGEVMSESELWLEIDEFLDRHLAQYGMTFALEYSSGESVPQRGRERPPAPDGAAKRSRSGRGLPFVFRPPRRPVSITPTGAKTGANLHL